jgi:succinoglycan biosynthesis transport protein ExoP
VTFLDFVRLTRANLLVILAAITVGVVLMFGWTLRQPVVYSATTTGFIEVGDADTAAELVQNMNIQTELAANYAGLISDRRVGERVVEGLELETSPEALAGQLTAVQEGESNRIAVTASSGSPAEARDLANAGIEALGEVISEVANSGNGEGTADSNLVRLESSDQALLPSTPTSPDYQRNLLMGAAGGLVLGYGLALMRRTIDRKIRNVAQVEEAGVGSVVGIIPAASPLSKSSRGISENLGVASEAFRVLRTNLRFVDVDRPPRSIVVTSANPNEGKSTVSSNLARMTAAAGQPTVLIDADLRKPSIASTFGLDPSVGLTQVLAGDVLIGDVLQVTDTPDLHVVTAGRIPPNPSELLGSQRMHSLIEQLTEEFLVIIDAPPLLPVTDAGLLAATTDGALLVVAVGKTRVEQVELSAKIFSQVGGRLYGAVLNMAPSRGLGAVVYGYGNASYETGYGGEDDSKSDRRGSRRSDRDPVEAEVEAARETPSTKSTRVSKAAK